MGPQPYAVEQILSDDNPPERIVAIKDKRLVEMRSEPSRGKRDALGQLVEERRRIWRLCAEVEPVVEAARAAYELDNLGELGESDVRVRCGRSAEHAVEALDRYCDRVRRL